MLACRIASPGLRLDRFQLGQRERDGPLVPLVQLQPVGKVGTISATTLPGLVRLTGSVGRVLGDETRSYSMTVATGD